MKTIIALLFLILSSNLFSQESKYFNKLDYDFDSGIKIIYFSEFYSLYYSNSFDIVTDSNTIYQFQSIESTPRKIEFNLPNEHIKDICRFNNNTYVITDSKKLFVRPDSIQDDKWKEIIEDIDSSSVNCIHQYRYNQYRYDQYEETMAIGTMKNGIYTLTNNSQNWEKIDKGLQNKNIVQFVEVFPDDIMYITDNNIIYNSLKPIDTLLIEGAIEKIIYVDFHTFIYLDNKGQLYFKDENGQRMCETIDSDKVTCFGGYQQIILYFQNHDIQGYYNILIGTQSNRIYSFSSMFQNIYYYFDYLPDIKAIEFNKINFPTLCLAGTNNGLYYATVTSVKDIANNVLKTNIFPQPAGMNANLNFTLPSATKIIAKLYNTLGIELQTIADSYFDSGENSIPINLSGLTDGVYIIAIQYQGKIITEKLVVRK